MVDVYIDVLETLTYPVLEVMIFPLVNCQVIRSELIHLAAVEVNAL
jgi:hypothetical protein